MALTVKVAAKYPGSYSSEESRRNIVRDCSWVSLYGVDENLLLTKNNLTIIIDASFPAPETIVFYLKQEKIHGYG